MVQKRIDSYIPQEPEEIPKDRYRIVSIVMLIHGMGLLLPWNMFITAEKYFIYYKLHENYTEIETPYNQYFLNYIGFAAQIPSVIASWLNVFVQYKCSLGSRIICTLIIQMVMFFFTIILAMVDSSGWPGAFFSVTIIIVIVMMAANAFYNNSTYGVVSKLPPKFIGTLIIGNNITGIFVTIISILSDVLLPNKRTAAIYYFLVAFYHLGICLSTFYILPINKYFRYYQLKFIKVVKQENKIKKEKIPYWKIFKKAFPQLLNAFMTLTVTLAVFPAIHVFVKPADKNFFIPAQFYTSITCFLTYNVFAMLGSLLASFYCWPKPKYLFIPVFARLVFIPLFLFCNYHPIKVERTLPVWIYNDWVYWFLGVLLGFTSGYYTSVSMMYVPGTVEAHHAIVASMYGSAVLITGVFFGILLSFLGPTLVSL